MATTVWSVWARLVQSSSARSLGVRLRLGLGKLMAMNWRNGRIEAGKLRHRIDIVTVNPTQDSTGGIDLSEDLVYANVWASVEPLAGMESLSAQSQTSVSTYQVVIRYIGAAPSWQAEYAYRLGFIIQDNAGYLQQAQGAGTSNTVAPTWNETAGGFTNDGDPSIGPLVWKNLGPAPPSSGVNAAMQMWWQGRQFQITSVQNPDGRRKMLCFNATEINDSRQQHPTMPGGLN